MAGKYDKFDYDEARRELWTTGIDPDELPDIYPARRDAFLQKSGFDPDMFKSTPRYGNRQSSSFSSPSYDSDTDLAVGAILVVLLAIILSPFAWLAKGLGISLPLLFLLIFVYWVLRSILKEKEELRLYLDLTVFALCLLRYGLLH